MQNMYYCFIIYFFYILICYKNRRERFAYEAKQIKLEGEGLNYKFFIN